MKSRWLVWIVFGLLIVIGFLVGGVGDKSIAVTFRNETGHALIVYPYGRDYPSAQRPLGPGADAKDNLLASGTDAKTHIARVEAVDESGSLVYCHSFNYGELSGNAGLIVIRLRDNTC